MKIAIITDRIYPYYFGGYERRAWLFAKELAKEHEVYVYTSCDKSDLIEGVNMISVRKRVEYFDKKGYRYLHQNIIFAITLLKHVFSSKFDIVDCNATPFFHIPISYILSLTWRANFYITAHEALSNEFLKYGKERKFPVVRILSYLMKTFYLFSHKLGRTLIAVSTNTEVSLRKEGFVSVSLIQNGLPSEYYKLGLATHPNTKKVCYFGRLAPNKNLDVLVESFRIFHSLHPESTLHLIGDGGSSEHLQNLVRSFELSDSVHFYGVVSEAKKIELARSMDCFVLPSLREGFSIVTLEAMALHIPVIVAFNPAVFNSGVTEFAQNGKNSIFFDGTVNDLLEKMNILFTNQSDTQKRVEQAFITACAYDITKLTVNLLQVYGK